MDPLSVTASIIALLQLSSTVLGYLNDVKDASRDRAKCAVEISNLYSLLFSLRSRLEEGSSDEPWNNEVRALGVKDGPLDQFKQALEQLQTKMTGGSRRKKVGDALRWKFSKEEITSIFARIERLKTLVQVALQMDHFKLCQAIKECTDMIRSNTEAAQVDIGFIQTHTLTTESRLDVIRQEQDRAGFEKCMGWLSSTDFPAQQSDLISRRQEGTGNWFLDTPEFTEWLHEPNGTLFCPGIPGAGKTMMTAIAMDYLLKKVCNGDVAVAYVYCNYKAQVDQNTAGLLAAILKQLVQARPSFAEPVEKLHEKHAKRETKPSVEEIFRALQSVLAKYSSVYIAVDALDECPDRDGTRRQLLAKLRALQDRADLRLLATSRFNPNIVGEFSAALTLEIRARDGDIKRYVAGEIYRLPKCIQRDETLIDMVQDKIVQAVDGMFLLAQLYVDSLLDTRTRKIVQDTLETMSKGTEALDKVYADAVERIKGQRPRDSALATDVLSWIIYARRPLTTKEICHALAVQPNDEEIELDNILDVEEIVSVCAGLVTVDKESDIIRLVHYTTQEYFQQVRGEWNFNVQLKLASTCLTYLSFRSFRSGGCLTESDLESRLIRNPFLVYAAEHWGSHTLTVQEELCELACSFLQCINSISSAMQAGSREVQHPSFFLYYPKDTTGLHLTAHHGLLRLSEELLSRSGRGSVISVDWKNSYGQTPLILGVASGHYTVVKLLIDQHVHWQCDNELYVASQKGHEQIVKLLLDYGAEVNAQGGQYDTALYAASIEGHVQTVKLLIDNGANVNAKGRRNHNSAVKAASARGHEQVVRLLLENGAEVNGEGDRGHPLYAASSGGHEQVVKLLIENGADVNAQEGDWGNALFSSSMKGHEQIVKLLLDHGAEEVNTQGGKYGTALQAASDNGEEQIVKLLLDNAAEVNAQGRKYGTALQVASKYGEEQIVKLLLDNGAEVNAQGGYWGTALYAASIEGHVQIVKLLLDEGAEVNVQEDDGNALHAASSRGHEQITMLLLNNGAEVNAQGVCWGSALCAASRSGYEKIVKLLLARGADFHTQRVRVKGNALYAASSRGHEQVVKLLLDNGAEVNQQSGRYGTALQVASDNGDEQIVKLLLDNGAEVNTQGGQWGTALYAASIQGHVQIVKLLLDKGADVNVQGFDGNALYAASARGHEQIVKLLLNNGAEFNEQGQGEKKYGTALQVASDNGKEQIVKLLLDNGAEVNAKGGRYGTALQVASDHGEEQIVKLLLDNGAEVNTQGGYWGTALYAASIEGHVQTVKLLLDGGADVNAQGVDGNALYAALARGHEQIVNLLLDNGAEVNEQGGKYDTALP
ncbi:hypothetical protein MMC07_009842, partial [Pseudocyphellaria aurata]|nr:hypothetical protein [Pseudocyphellaria aurata]